ncbi:MAG: AhpC/TSA family protein, partial [Halobacteria archaeon]|nr:AhpC/TSA family protein [Halobacteria archaeon]
MRLNVGDKAPYFQMVDVKGETQTPVGDGKYPTLLSFYRHAGCPPCNLRVRELILAKQELDRNGLRLIGVFESPAKSIRRDLYHAEVPFPILPDPERHLYEHYSVTPSLLGFVKSFLLSPGYSIKAIFKHGYLPKFVEATTMMPADFLIAPDGTIKLAYYAKDINDYLPFEKLYAALADISLTGQMVMPSTTHQQ